MANMRMLEQDTITMARGDTFLLTINDEASGRTIEVVTKVKLIAGFWRWPWQRAIKPKVVLDYKVQRNW